LRSWLTPFCQDTGLLLVASRIAGVYVIYCLPEEKEKVRELILSVGLDSLKSAMREYLHDLGYLNGAEIERCLENPFGR
jgi:hypothetical protein